MKNLLPTFTSVLNFFKSAKVIGIISICLIAFFLITTIFTYAPIAIIELQYQSHKFLSETFHVNDLRALIMPQFNFDFSTSSKYPTAGMTIPKLYVDEPIIFNVDPQNRSQYMAALKVGIAQAAGTNLPGYQGLGYYFAHSSSPENVIQYNAVFYLLGKLQVGDEVDIWHNGQKHVYRVYTSQITSPDDLNFLHQTYDRETIVLQTCWPPGTTLKRLLVFARSE